MLEEASVWPVRLLASARPPAAANSKRPMKPTHFMVLSIGLRPLGSEWTLVEPGPDYYTSARPSKTIIT